MSALLQRLRPGHRDLPVYRPGLPVEEVARRLGIPREGIAKLASNENPLGPSPAAIEAMRHCAGAMHRYPDGSARRLRGGIAEALDLDPDQVILGNGSNELIELAGHAFLGGPERKAVVSQYGFAIYGLVARLFGSEVVAVPARDHASDTEAMLRSLSSGARVLFIAEPNNPTGTQAGSEALLRLIREAPGDVLLVVDQAYGEYLEDPPDLLALVRDGSQANLLVLRTFSKIHGLAGLRIGYGLGSRSLIGALERLRQPFNTSAMAQEAALAALGDAGHVERSRRHNRREIGRFEAFCRRRRWTYLPSLANFVLLRTGDGSRAFDLLLRQGIIVRPMGGNGLPEWIRITMGTREENERCLQALDGILPTAASSRPLPLSSPPAS